MPNADTVRHSVKEAYTRAVNKPVANKQDAGGCCDDTCCETTSIERKGVAVKSAGYQAEELGDLPTEAVVNSFGCGNPLAFAEVNEGDVVLDLGSGAGIDLLIASTKVGPSGKVIGVDMTDAMIEKAKQNIKEAKAHNVEVRQGTIENLPVDSASVDWVISNCVINLSPEKELVFAEISRVLKPGGRVSISDIVVDNLPDSIRQHERVYNSCIGGAISEAEYAAGLQQAGLVDVRVTDRIVYGSSELGAIVESELPEYDPESGCCGAGGCSLQALAEEITGQVQSVRFYAKKP